MEVQGEDFVTHAGRTFRVMPYTINAMERLEAARTGPKYKGLRAAAWEAFREAHPDLTEMEVGDALNNVDYTALNQVIARVNGWKPLPPGEAVSP